MSTSKPHSLLCHPASPCAVVHAIDVAVAFADSGDLSLRYVLHGKPAAIRLPAARPPLAADGLWQHTCCEAFFAGEGDSYREFNFSPSGEWAVYAFAGYRQRVELAVAAAPQIRLQSSPDTVVLSVELPAALLPPGENWRLGLTVVVEAGDGSKSYWALQHCAEQPDFHLRQSFSLPLKAMPT